MLYARIQPTVTFLWSSLCENIYPYISIEEKHGNFVNNNLDTKVTMTQIYVHEYIIEAERRIYASVI